MCLEDFSASPGGIVFTLLVLIITSENEKGFALLSRENKD